MRPSRSRPRPRHSFARTERVWSCAGLSPEHGRVAGGELGERGGSDAEPFVGVEAHGRFGSFAPFAEQFVEGVGEVGFGPRIDQHPVFLVWVNVDVADG